MSTDKVFDGDQNSPQYVLFLADEVMSKTTFNGTTARFVYLARRLAERLIDFEADFKKTVADTCAPDEKHCSCVPHLRRAYHELSNQVVQTFAPHLGFPRAPDENGNEDPNAPYVVDPFVAEDIIGLAGEQFETLLAWKKSNEPRWSSEIPTVPGHYWFYGTNSLSRHPDFQSGKGPCHIEVERVSAYSEACNYRHRSFEIRPYDDGYVGKWLKFTPPTPEVDNENG